MTFVISWRLIVVVKKFPKEVHCNTRVGVVVVVIVGGGDMGGADWVMGP